VNITFLALEYKITFKYRIVIDASKVYKSIKCIKITKIIVLLMIHPMIEYVNVL